jgi:hypothetical protein
MLRDSPDRAEPARKTTIEKMNSERRPSRSDSLP